MRGELYQPLGLHLDDRKVRRAPSLSLLAGLAAFALTAGASAYVATLAQPRLTVVDRLAPTGPAPRQPGDVRIAMAAPVKATALPNIISGSNNLPDDPGLAGVQGTRSVGFRVEDPTSLRQNPSIAHLPDPDLVEGSAYGPLPIRDASGRRPFDVYAGATDGRPGARIAIVVGGLGISQSGTFAALKTLPSEVTLGFSPAGNSLQRWMRDARRKGHELLLQVPLEPVGYPAVDPGENTVTVAEAAAGQFDALYASLGAISNYVGIMNYMGGRFTGDPAAMEGLLGELGRRGLMYVDDASSRRSLAKDTAQLEHVPAAVADLTLDNVQDPNEIRGQLDLLERMARVDGHAIGIASAFDTSIATIAAWIAEARERGIDIVPISDLADDPERH